MACGIKLNKEIIIQIETATPDGGGGSASSWVNIPTDPTPRAKIENFMNIKNPTGRDRFMHGKVQNEQTYKFIIRHRTDITPDMKIIYNGDDYNIRTILPDEVNGKYMEIFGEKGIAV